MCVCVYIYVCMCTCVYVCECKKRYISVCVCVDEMKECRMLCTYVFVFGHGRNKGTKIKKIMNKNN